MAGVLTAAHSHRMPPRSHPNFHFHPIALSLRGWRSFDSSKRSLGRLRKPSNDVLLDGLVGTCVLVIVAQERPKLFDIGRAIFGEQFKLLGPPMLDDFDESKLFDKRGFCSPIGNIFYHTLEMIADSSLADTGFFWRWPDWSRPYDARFPWLRSPP